MPFPSGDQFSDVPHPDSDIPDSVTREDGSVARYVNMLGCSEPNCNADFNHPMTRAWHIRQRHPGAYSGATPDMDIFQEVTGLDLGLSKRYLFKEGDPKPVRGVDFGPGID
jgi:hypothetical protein